jgi:hypothetical protein
MDGMVPASIADVAPWRDWPSAAEGLLRSLHEHVGWDLWMVSRVVDDQQIVLCAFPEGIIRPGASLPWERSLCRQMVEGNAPRMATVTAAIPEYAALTDGPLRDVSAYVGMPLVNPDLTLFGTLCGVAFRAQPRSAVRELDVIETAARVLSTLLAAGMQPAGLVGACASDGPG